MEASQDFLFLCRGTPATGDASNFLAIQHPALFVFQEKPFAPDPNPDFLYLSDAYETALAVLANGLANGVSLNAVLGDSGTGKTTLIRYLLRHNPPGSAVGVIKDAIQSKDDLARRALESFAKTGKASKTKNRFERLVGFLRANHKKRQQPALLIVDCAHTMGADALNGLGLLSEINTQENLILQIVLVGQKKLLQALTDCEVEGFSKKIGTLCYLEPLTAEETKSYIYHRLDLAGASGNKLFDEEACFAVHGYSKGVPKATNALCREALACGNAQQIDRIDASLIHKIVKASWQPQAYLERIPTLEREVIKIPWYEKYGKPTILVAGFFAGMMLALLLAIR